MERVRGVVPLSPPARGGLGGRWEGGEEKGKEEEREEEEGGGQLFAFAFLLK
jgi:hypothetical protein